MKGLILALALAVIAQCAPIIDGGGNSTCNIDMFGLQCWSYFSVQIDNDYVGSQPYTHIFHAPTRFDLGMYRWIGGSGTATAYYGAYGWIDTNDIPYIGFQHTFDNSFITRWGDPTYELINAVPIRFGEPFRLFAEIDTDLIVNVYRGAVASANAQIIYNAWLQRIIDAEGNDITDRVSLVPAPEPGSLLLLGSGLAALLHRQFRRSRRSAA